MMCATWHILDACIISMDTYQTWCMHYIYAYIRNWKIKLGGNYLQLFHLIYFIFATKRITFFRKACRIFWKRDIREYYMNYMRRWPCKNCSRVNIKGLKFNNYWCDWIYYILTLKSHKKCINNSSSWITFCMGFRK